MELVTSTISPAQIRAEVDHICQFLLLHGIRKLTVSYGWACNLDQDELWKDLPLASTDLSDFVDRAISAAIYVPGSSDLFISDSAQQFQFQLCHEADIHFRTDNLCLFDSVRSEWLARGHTGYEKIAERDNWKPFPPELA